MRRFFELFELILVVSQGFAHVFEDLFNWNFVISVDVLSLAQKVEGLWGEIAKLFGVDQDARHDAAETALVLVIHWVLGLEGVAVEMVRLIRTVISFRLVAFLDVEAFELSVAAQG